MPVWKNMDTDALLPTVPVCTHVCCSCQWPNMVLSAATETFADDFSPSSDNDKYDSSPQEGQQVEIDITRLPRPLPVLGPLFGFSEQRRMIVIGNSILHMCRIMQRPLTQDEATAVSYHVSKAFATESYGIPLGGMAGSFRAYQTRGTFKFPFVQPDLLTFNADKFGPLKNGLAKLSWHALRGITYAGLGGFIASAVIGSYAAAVAATSQRMDPRMRGIVETLKQMGLEESNRRNMKTRSTDQETLHGMVSLDENGTATFGDEQLRTQEIERVSSHPPSFDFDDAAPTGSSMDTREGIARTSAWDTLRREQRPAIPSPNSSTRQPQASAGSAWANMRRVGDSQQEPREELTVGDSFHSSESDEEKRLAKAKAQTEFDARLDQERSGRDFEDSGRKW